MTANRTGFTIIELVIVITIIAILAGISSFSMINYIASSRDSRRMIDLQAIAVNLDISYKKNGFLYPMSNASAQDIIFLSGGVTQTGGKIGEIYADQLTDLSQMPVDPKKKSYYMYGLTQDRKRYEIASRLEQKDLGQTLLNNISDPDIFGDNIYIIGNYREDFTKGYYLRGLIAMSGSVNGGFVLPNTPINVGTWNPATVSIDYNTTSAVVVQKSQTTY